MDFWHPPSIFHQSPPTSSMAAIHDFKPRRKLVTYGKPSRKQIQVFDHIEPDFFDQDLNRICHHDAEEKKQGPLARSFPNTANGFGKEAFAVSGTAIVKDSTRSRRKQSHRSKLGVSRSPSTMSETDSQNQGGHNELFDVPSSDDEPSQVFASRIGRKRIRLSPAIQLADDIVFDDDTLQQHIASEVLVDGGSASCLGTRKQPPQPKPKHQTIGGPPSVTQLPPRSQSRTSPDPRNAKAISSRSNIPRKHSPGSEVSGIVRSRNTKMPVKPVDHITSRPSTRQSSPAISDQSVSRLVNSSPEDLAETPQTPERRRKLRPRQRDSPSSNSTPPPKADTPSVPDSTPRQAKFLSDLLEQSNANGSPSHIGLNRLSLRTEQKPPAGRTRTGKVAHGVPRKLMVDLPKAQLSRKRLIDSLNPSRMNSSDSSNEDSNSDNEMWDSKPQSSFAESVDSRAKEGPSSSQTNNASQTGEAAAADPVPTSSQSSSQIGGPKITYARQRSHLSDNALQDMIDVPIPPVSQTFGQSNQHRPNLHNRPVLVPILADDIDEDAILSKGALRPIHELRQAGGNARLLGDIEAIFEDIENYSTGSVSRNRSGLIQLCSKLTDDAFARRFLDNSFDKRLAACHERQQDIISSFLVVCSVATLISTNPTTSATSHLCYQMVIERSVVLLDEERDMLVLAKDRQSNMSKASRADLLDLLGQIQESKLWNGQPPSRLSPQIMVLRCVDRVRETGGLSGSIPIPLCERLVNTLALRSSMPRSDYSPSDEFLVMELTLSILEASTSAIGAVDDSHADVLSRLSNLGPLLSSLDGRMDNRSRKVQILALRLILNVTNNNPPLCDVFATRELVGAVFRTIHSKFGLVFEDLADDQRDPVLDIVILALGLMMNLTEWSDTSRKLILGLQEDSKSYIECLLHFFTERLAAVSEVRPMYRPTKIGADLSRPTPLRRLTPTLHSGGCPCC